MASTSADQKVGSRVIPAATAIEYVDPVGIALFSKCDGLSHGICIVKRKLIYNMRDTDFEIFQGT